MPPALPPRPSREAAPRCEEGRILSADYRRTNPLPAAFAQVGYTPDEIVNPAFSYRSKEEAVLLAWRELAIARGYADEAAAQSWDTEHLRNTYEIFARINGVWSDFPVSSVNKDGKVMRGDSKHLYASFGGFLKPQEHPDGGYVTVGTKIRVDRILVRTGEHREEKADKYGKSAVVVVFADILAA
ncbi:hypothetical protein ACIQZO_13485 [Streptomyces sp. NPDC097617]|uniref:hypothetical protein n=1 Tax=Streptomyces sp. NPDC097617 TaxID=3366091 RepID=UPI00381F60EF